MTIIADKIVFGGKSLTKIEGKNVFIPFAIPGEKLDIEITESLFMGNRKEVFNCRPSGDHFSGGNAMMYT